MHRRDEFVEVARTWVGVPWCKVGTRRDGVNCLGLPVGAARELGGLEDLVDKATPYANFTRPPVYGEMLRRMKEHLRVVPRADVLPGDILLFRLNDDPQHVALVTGGGMILHSHRKPGMVREQFVPAGWVHAIAFRIEELG